MIKTFSFVCVFLVFTGCAFWHVDVPQPTSGRALAPVVWLSNPVGVETAEFGAASDAVDEYFEFWADKFQAGPGNAMAEITEAGGGDWWQGLEERIGDFYSIDDFRDSAAILHQAVQDSSGRSEIGMLQRLLVTHRIAELTFVRALFAAEAAETGAAKTELEAAERRLEALKDKLGGQALFPWRPPVSAMPPKES